MLLQRYKQIIQNQQIAPGVLTVLNLPAQNATIPIDNTDAAEGIIVLAQATAKADLIPVADGAQNLCRQFTLTVPEPNGSRTVVSCSGPALVELIEFEGGGLDRSTREAVKMTNQNIIPNNTVWRVAYYIPFPHPMFTDSLRMKTLLPLHLLDQPAQLRIDFGAAADICGTADPVSAFACEVIVVRRRANGNTAFLKGGGDSLDWFIKGDILETPCNPVQGVANQEVRIPIPAPGRIPTVGLRFFKAPAVNNVLARLTYDDLTVIAGETIWELQRGGTAFHKFRLKHEQVDNDYGRWNDQLSTITPNSGMFTPAITAAALTGAAPALVAAKKVLAPLGFGADSANLGVGFAIQDPASVFIDFTGAPARECYDASGFLNVTDPLAVNQRTEVFGKVTAPNFAGNVIKMLTRRYEEKISTLAAIKAGG